MTDLKIENTQYQQSELLEAYIINHGLLLCNLLMRAKVRDELLVLLNNTSSLSVLCSAYSECTGRIREDLGVNLNEAAIMKYESLKNKKNTEEWKYFADNAQNDFVIEHDYLRNELKNKLLQ